MPPDTDEDEEVDSPPMPWAKPWQKTIFAAVASIVMQEPTWEQRRTQKRHVERAALWCALGSDDRMAEQVAEAVGVGVMVHQQARLSLRAATDLRARAMAVSLVLEAMPRDARLCKRLLRAGQLTGCCQGAWWWDESCGYQLLFQPPERPP